MQLMPMIRDAGIPIPPEMFDYLPLPSDFVEALKQRMQGDPQQAAVRQAATSLELRKTAAEAGQKEADALLKRTQAAKEQTEMWTGGS